MQHCQLGLVEIPRRILKRIGLYARRVLQRRVPELVGWPPCSFVCVVGLFLWLSKSSPILMPKHAENPSVLCSGIKYCIAGYTANEASAFGGSGGVKRICFANIVVLAWSSKSGALEISCVILTNLAILGFEASTIHVLHLPPMAFISSME